MTGEFARDVLGGDLSQVEPGRRPRGQSRPGDAQVMADAPEGGRSVPEAAAAAQHPHPA
ncbi:hypothetical protein ABT246_40580 [Streptomyces sp. NPDC001553]|uniref:hypothetical protein n=1 Tax=Streptomyces sp. NPDC001553 TaxID=3154385 RepID=UPI00331F58D6